MNRLDQMVRDYYGEQALAEDRITRIIESAKLVRPPWWRQPAWLTAAAAVVLAGLCLAVLATRIPPEITVLVATEVAKNHQKYLEPEHASDRFEQVQAALPRLGFAITPTRKEMLAGLTLTGGRYCSVQGELAAQLSLQDQAGRRCTLYVAPLTEHLREAQPGVLDVAGVEIQIWHDAHCLYVLARGPRE